MATSLNLKKCNVICISNKRHQVRAQYFINNTLVKRVDTVKYLGITIHQKLKLGDQVSGAIVKAIFSGVIWVDVLSRLRVGPIWHWSVPILSMQSQYGRHIFAIGTVQLTSGLSPVMSACQSELHWPKLETRREVLSCCQTFNITHHFVTCHTIPQSFPSLSRVNAYQFV